MEKLVGLRYIAYSSVAVYDAAVHARVLQATEDARGAVHCFREIL